MRILLVTLTVTTAIAGAQPAPSIGPIEPWPEVMPVDQVPAALRPGRPEPLPRGAIARLGTRAFRLIGTVQDQRTLAFLADGQLQVTEHTPDGIVTRDLVRGTVLRRYPFARRGNFTVSPDGKRVALGCSSPVNIVDANGGDVRLVSPVARPPAHPGQGIGNLISHSSTCTAFSPDGSRLASAQRDGTFLWDVATGDHVATIAEAHCDGRLIAWSAKGQLACTITAGVALLDATTGKRTAVLRRSETFAFSVDGSAIVTIEKGRATMHSLPAGRPGATLAVLPGREAVAAALSHDGKLLAVSTEHVTRVFEIATGRMLPAPDGHDAEVEHVALSPDGTRLVTGGRDGAALIWKLETATVERVLERAPESVAVAWSPDGRHITTAHDAGYNHTLLRTYDPASGAVTARSPRIEGQIIDVLYAPDGRIAGAGQSLLRLFSAVEHPHTGLLQLSWPTLAFSRDAKRLLIGSKLSTTDVSVYDLASGAVVRTLDNVALRGQNTTIERGFGNGVNAIALTPDGKRAAIAARGGNVYLFELSTGKHLGCIPADAEAIAFDRTGRNLVAGREDGVVEIWKATAFVKPVWAPGHLPWRCPRARPIARRAGHAGAITSLAVGASTVATGSADGTVLIWRVP